MKHADAVDAGPSLSFEWTPEQLRWRQEVRAFLDAEITPELRNELFETGGLTPMRGPLEWEFRHKVAAKGWIGLRWPEEYGGLGKSALHEWILLEEFAYARAPSFDLTETTFAPIILESGTEDNKKTWLPQSASLDTRLVMGQSEPNAGTDLSNIQTRAETDGDVFVINGQKIWNSLVHTATHEWLAARTRLPGHEDGISIILVPTKSEGISVQPLWGWDEARTNQTFFDNVRVPRTNLIGEPGRGLVYARTAMEIEGVKAARVAPLRHLFEELVDYCRVTTFDGQLLAHRPDVRTTLAKLDAALEVARLLGIRTAVIADSGGSSEVAGEEQKVFVTETAANLAHWGMQMLDITAALNKRSRFAPLRGRLEELYRRTPLRRFTGGSNEIMRDVIAQRAYGLPGPNGRR